MSIPLPAPEAAVGLTRRRQVATLGADVPVWIISDLHLGDGTPSDAFFGKDRHLLALIEHVERAGGTLVVNGDAIDFHQAWGFLRVVRAHQAVLEAMSRLGREGRLVYVIGNHDYDITVFRDLLSFRVCDELHIGDKVLVRHGYEYDPYILDMLDKGQWHTLVHHGLERLMGVWLRIPLGEFYNVPNRVMFWVAHKVGVIARTGQRLGARLKVDTPLADEVIANLDFWCWSNLGDSMGIFRPAMQDVAKGTWDVIVCGHSHLPGIVTRSGRTYANTGSWTFASSQFLVWDGQTIRSHDWITGREYRDELYQPMLDGTLYERDFFQWWRENYLGWFRFREGEERRGKLRHWESYLRDHQRLSLLRPVPQPPAPVVTPERDKDAATGK
jgi:UDP-2,3-diacylglucosamine pyrophosphatase LpxH